MKELLGVLNEIDSKPLSTGETIRLIRTKRYNLTLKDIESITMIKETHLSAIENNKMELSLKNAKKLGAALGVHPSVLLFPEGDYEKTDEIKEIEKRRSQILKSAAG